MQNIEALLLDSDVTQKHVEQVIHDIAKKECKMQCNISLYDDEKALQLAYQYNNLSDANKMTEWKRKYGKYVSEHWVGYKMFSDDEVMYYPDRNNY